MSHFRGPYLHPKYKEHIKRILADGGNPYMLHAKHFQNDLNSVIDTNPSLLMIPTSYKNDKIYSIYPQTGSGDFTISRNGSGTYFDKDGILRTAAANEPRFDFDPLTGEFRGLLVEPSATNIVLHSYTFNSNWVIQGDRIQRTYNQEIAPDGTFTATRFTRVIDGAYLVRQVFPSGTFTPSSTWTYSVWVKVNETQTFNLDISDRGNSFHTVNPEEGWKRLSFTFTFLSTETFANGSFFDISSTTLLLGQSHFLWGAQVQSGNILTSYIPTTTSQITRPADIIDVTVPSGVTEIIQNVNGIESTITEIGETYQLPEGHITSIVMK